MYIDAFIGKEREKQYPYYGGLFRALKQNFDIRLNSEFFDDFSKIERNFRSNYDLVVFGLSYFENFQFYDKLKNLDIPTIVHIFKPQNNFNEKLSFCIINNIDHIVTSLPMFKQIEEKTNIPSSLFPYGYNPQIFRERTVKKIYDIGFSGMLHQNKYYPNNAFPVLDLRKRIGVKLNSNNKLRVFWKGNDDIKYGRINNILEYARTINKCKIWIATPAAFGDMTPRYFEIMGSKTLLFCSEIPTEYKDIFIDTVNCVEFKNDLSDFYKKLDYILNTPEYYQNIVETAYLQAISQHTWDKRANNLLNIINDIEKSNRIINHQL